ncbi:MAG: LysR family transcriptional regulator [Spirochaetaceae bacterium]|jgi:DNA-binding transcriptional LysR family regulator|nr:LysR family transcriptional regulator [Spirochaetaceae bacterium]
MEYHQLLNFLGVCEEKNFTKASKRRFITQQGISKSIKELENELEVPLFFRTRQGIVLTEFGIALEKAAKTSVNQYHYILDTMKQLKEKTRGFISIGIVNGLNDILPLNFFKTFLDPRRDISLNLMSFTDDECQDAIAEHKLQVGLSPAPVDSSRFESRFSKKSEIGLITGKKHRLSGRPSIRMRELRDEEVIILNYNKYLIDMCAMNGIRSIIHLKASEISLIYELCSTNRIVAFWADSIYRFPGLAHIEVEDIEVYREYHLIVNRHVYISDAAEQFISYAERELAKAEPE